MYVCMYVCKQESKQWCTVSKGWSLVRWLDGAKYQHVSER